MHIQQTSLFLYFVNGLQTLSLGVCGESRLTTRWAQDGQWDGGMGFRARCRREGEREPCGHRGCRVLRWVMSGPLWQGRGGVWHCQPRSVQSCSHIQALTHWALFNKLQEMSLDPSCTIDLLSLF